MSELMKRLKQHKALFFTVIVFAVLYSLISIVNHYQFRTYALDLGAYTNALYDYAHFQWNDSTVFKSVPENLLADHFDLYLPLFSPLIWVFGTYTLLVVQIFFLLLGGIGVYAYLIEAGKTKFIANCAAIFFCSFFGVFAAVSFDYHSNVIATCVIPWFFLFVKKERLVKASLLLLMILIAKENMSLWLIFVCIGLAIEYRKSIRLRNYLMLCAALSAIYFVLISMVVMPSFSMNGAYPHFHYSVLGTNITEAIVQLLSHPIDSLKVLFINHTNDPFGNYVKLELYILLLLSGIPFLIKKPQYLLMLIPIFFQKLFHDNISMWGIEGQYSIEFAPILAIGIFSVIAEMKNNKFTYFTSISVLILTIGSSIRSMDNTVLLSDKTKIRLYQAKHYKKNYDVKKAMEQLAIIPANAVVSAQSPFVPHLSLRDNIYQFPTVKNAEYLVVSERENTYPLSIEQFKVTYHNLLESKEWKVISNKEVVILKRNH